MNLTSYYEQHSEHHEAQSCPANVSNKPDKEMAHIMT